MPVIRGQAKRKTISAAQRAAIVEQLRRELEGSSSANAPMIYEIPLGELARIDVLVVWDGWEPVPAEMRSDAILEAYQGRESEVAQTLGLTYREAVEQQVMPYAVSPAIREGEIDPRVLTTAMLKEGAFVLGNGKVELRFPTKTMAEEAHRRLTDQIPKGYWSILES